MSQKVSDSVGYRTARQTATAMTRFLLHALVSLSFMGISPIIYWTAQERSKFTELESRFFSEVGSKANTKNSMKDQRGGTWK